MQDWKLHSQETGGYFQCNRFEDKSGKNESDADAGRRGYEDDDEEEEESMNLRFYGDVGSSRREEMKVREQGQRMERFLHHYTRFRSHDDSAKMEAKMHVETMERLCRILIASIDNISYQGHTCESIPWLQQHVANPFTATSTSASYANKADPSAVGLSKQSLEDESEEDLLVTLVTDELRLLQLSQQQRDEQRSSQARLKGSGEGDKSWISQMMDGFRGSGSPGAASISASAKKAAAVTNNSRRTGCRDATESNVPAIQLFAARGDKPKHNSNSDFGEIFALFDSTYSGGTDYSRMNRIMAKMQGIEFLQLGFRELLKCRQLLKGSFAFAFYFFGEESGKEKKGWRSHSKSAAMQSKKLLFEQGQADLNSMTETLSDVVARRRLRASQTIIEQASKGARASRLEFERILHNCVSRVDEDVDQRFNRYIVMSEYLISVFILFVLCSFSNLIIVNQ